MIKYKVVMEITIADTDAPPSHWLPDVLKKICEEDETVVLIECKEIAYV
jgi:hypothetical protein